MEALFVVGFIILAAIAGILVVQKIWPSPIVAASFEEFIFLLDREDVPLVVGEIKILSIPRNEYELGLMADTNPLWITARFFGKSSSGREVELLELYTWFAGGNAWQETQRKILEKLIVIANDERSVKYRDGSTLYSLDELREIVESRVIVPQA